MNTEKEKKEISFLIDDIDLINKGMIFPELKDGKFPEHTFNINLEISISEKDKKSRHVLNVEIISKENNLSLGNVSVACTFKILNFEDIVEKAENDNISIPSQYLDILNTITVGTTRGVMYNEFRGTFLHQAILPVLDIKEFQGK